MLLLCYLIQLIGLFKVLDDGLQSLFESDRFFEGPIDEAVMVGVVNAGSLDHEEKSVLCGTIQLKFSTCKNIVRICFTILINLHQMVFTSYNELTFYMLSCDTLQYSIIVFNIVL